MNKCTTSGRLCLFRVYCKGIASTVIHYFALFPVFPALLIIIFFYSCPLEIVCPKYILRASSCLRLFFQGILARQYNNDLFMFLFLLGDCKLLESRNHVIFFVISTLVPDIKQAKSPHSYNKFLHENIWNHKIKMFIVKWILSIIIIKSILLANI